MAKYKLTQGLLHHLRHDYWCHITATYQDNQAPSIIDVDRAPTFYEWLLMYGFTRQQLAALGVGKDSTA
jgi:hypothetical protein